ncbi:MAG: dTMP kinase [Anaerolineales bacterium]|nr:dTMP kinase [Anaerolineales bacterium]
MFITFEGSEGSGKSSQILLLSETLRQKGYDVLLTREPGGTAIGEQIRAILSNLDNVAMQQRTEILLFQASRAQLVEEVIRPHLVKGSMVLCDRYADSTLAYQGYGYQRNLDQVRHLVDFATDNLKPDLTLFLDLEVEEGLQRRARGGSLNRLDTYDLDFYRRVRQGYLELAAQEPERWVVIDASLPFAQVQDALLAAVLLKLAQKSRV